MSEISRLKRKLQDTLSDLEIYDKKAYKQSFALRDIKKIDYDSDELNYLIEIPLIKKQKYSFSVKKSIFGDKDKKIKFVNSINDIIVKINNHHKKNIIAKYQLNKIKYFPVQCFVIRKIFVYYMQIILNSLREVNDEEIQSIKYNIDEEINKITKDDNWILADNFIKENMSINIVSLKFNNGENCILQNKKNELINIMKNCDSKVEWISLIVRLNSVSSIKNDILNNVELHKMMSRIDSALLDFIDFYMDKDTNFIETYFNSKEDFKYILAKLGYKYTEFHEGDTLNLEYCKTLDVDITNDIEKDFQISKVYKQGVLKNNLVVRKAFVNVYRFNND